MQIKKQQLECCMEKWTGSKLGQSRTRLYIVTLFISLLSRVHHMKCWFGWLTSWDQDMQMICRYADDMQICRRYHANSWKWRGTSPDEEFHLMRVKQESEKAGLKLNIQKTKIIASSLITSWQIEEKKVETVAHFILGGLQNHCRQWLQPWSWKTLALWKGSYDPLRLHLCCAVLFCSVVSESLGPHGL